MTDNIKNLSKTVPAFGFYYYYYYFYGKKLLS